MWHYQFKQQQITNSATVNKLFLVCLTILWRCVFKELKTKCFVLDVSETLFANFTRSLFLFHIVLLLKGPCKSDMYYKYLSLSHWIMKSFFCV